MTICTTIADVARLQGARPKLLLHSTSPSREAARVRALSEVDVLWLHIDANGDFVVSASTRIESDQPLRPLTVLPARVLLVWGFRDDSMSVVSRFKRTLKGTFSGATVAAGVGDINACRRALVTAALDEASMFAREASALAQALVELRAENQTARKALQGLQDVAWSIRDNPPRLAAAVAPGDALIDARALAEDGIQTLVQPLPLTGRGLVGVDLWVARPGDEGHALGAVLSCEATGKVAGCWTIDAAASRSGWLHMALPESLVDDLPKPTLSVRLVGDEAPTLALGAADVMPEFRLQADGEPHRSGAVLATRAWVAFPGRPNESMRDIDAGRRPPDWFDYELDANTLATFQPTTQHQAPFEYLRVDRGGGLLVHPLVGVEVGAIIEHALPRGTRSVEATIGVAGDCPSTCEFAAAAVPENTMVDASELGPLHPACVGSSGWLPIGANHQHEKICFDVPDAARTESLHLLLFTRVPNGGSVDYAHCNFHSIRLARRLNRATYTGTDAWSAPGSLVPASRGRATTSRNRHRSRTRRAAPHNGRPALTQITRQLGSANVREAYPLHNFDVDFVSFAVRDETELMVHPVLNALNAVCVPRAVPRGCRQIQAEIVKGSTCGLAIDCGIGIANTEISGPLDKRALENFACARVRESDVEGEVVLVLEEPTSEARSLYLFSSVHDSPTVDFADLYFRNVRFVLDN